MLTLRFKKIAIPVMATNMLTLRVKKIAIPVMATNMLTLRGKKIAIPVMATSVFDPTRQKNHITCYGCRYVDLMGQKKSSYLLLLPTC